MRTLLVAIALLLCAAPALAFDARIDEGRAYLLPAEIAVRRAARLSLPELSTLEDPATAWPTDEVDRLEIVVRLLGRWNDETLLGRIGRTARRIQRITRPSDGVRLRFKIDPVRDEYRATVRVRF